MIKLEKDSLVKFLREDLPVLGVDLIIGGVKIARRVTDKAARLIAQGTIPAPGFIVDKARQQIESQEDFYKVAEPEHGWDKPGFPDAEKEGDLRIEEAPARVKSAAGPSRKGARKTKGAKKAASGKSSPAAAAAKGRRSSPRRKETLPAEETKAPASSDERK
jgi:hypothetical protein